MGDRAAAVFHDPRSRLHDPDELRAADTHGIAHWTTNRLIADSTGLGWHDGYTSLAVESSWTAELPAVPHYSLAYFARGSASIDRRLEGAAPERAHLSRRQFGMIPTDRPSSWSLVGEPEVQLVYIRRETMDALALGEFDVDPSSVYVEPRLGFDDALLEQLAVALLQAAMHDEPGASGLWADQLIRLIGLRLLRRHSNLSSLDATPCGAPQGAVEFAMEYIDSNLTGDLSLAGIGAAVGVTPHRLAKQFRRHTGSSLHQWVIQRRLERARRLLAGTDEPIALIAIDCGFASQSHLTTAFRRQLGTTPARFRAGA